MTFEEPFVAAMATAVRTRRERPSARGRGRCQIVPVSRVIRGVGGPPPSARLRLMAAAVNVLGFDPAAGVADPGVMEVVRDVTPRHGRP